MSLSDKVNAIKEIVSLVVSILPRIVDVLVEICTLVREAKQDA